MIAQEVFIGLAICGVLLFVMMYILLTIDMINILKKMDKKTRRRFGIITAGILVGVVFAIVMGVFLAKYV